MEILLKKRLQKCIGKKTSEDIISLYVKDSIIKVDKDHSFYLPTEIKWSATKSLTEGQFLLNSSQELIKIDQIQSNFEQYTVFDISVKDYNNYFVSENEILVHNFGFAIPFVFAFGAGGITFSAGDTLALLGSALMDFAIRKIIYQRSSEIDPIPNNFPNNTPSPSPNGPKDPEDPDKNNKNKQSDSSSIASNTNNQANTNANSQSANNANSQANTNLQSNTSSNNTSPNNLPSVNQTNANSQSSPSASTIGTTISLVSKKIKELIDESERGRKTGGRTIQYIRQGGLEQANRDFNSLSVLSIKNISVGRTGYLPDGRNITVRTRSSLELPTLEIINPNKRYVKFRYTSTGEN